MIKNIPKRRFKGFNDEWEEKKLKENYDFYKGKKISLKSFSSNSLNKAIAYGHLYTIYDEVITKVEKLSNEEGFLSLKGDILFPGSSTVPLGTAQANALMLDNIHLGGDVLIARDRNERNFSPFMSYLINYQKYKMFPITTGTTIAHMYGKDLEILIYIVPSLLEQQKIGDFFQKLDKQISLYDQKINKLKYLKKSYLNKMFPKENTLYPELRFEGFNDEWEGKKLGEIAKYRNGKAHENVVVDNGKYVVVNSKFVSSESKIKIFSDKLLEPLYKDEIVFVLSDVPNGKAIAKTFIINENNRYTLNQRVAAITPKISESSYFIHILVNRNEYFLKFDDGVSQTNLSIQNVVNFSSLYPSHSEQQKIGSFFSKLDTLINLYEDKYNKLKDLKKAYLNEMFVNK